MAEAYEAEAPRAQLRVPLMQRGRSATQFAPAQHGQSLDIDAQFIALLQALRPHGGLARQAELAARLRRHAGAVPEALQPLIGSVPMLAFTWSGLVWVPLFQFASDSMAMRPDVQCIVAALRLTHDGWQTAIWFTQQSALLDGAMPIDRLADDAQAVLNAALRIAGSVDGTGASLTTDCLTRWPHADTNTCPACQNAPGS